MSNLPATIGYAAIPRAALTPMDMLNRAIESGAAIETLTKLMELQERWEKSQARKAFDEALAAAKAEIPVIRKNKEVGFKATSYRHEDLGEIARTVDPVLAKHGLSYRFRPEQQNGTVKLTCILSHRDGHSEESSLSAGHDTTGSKNAIQAVGSTVTYLQRYTLKMALGLAAAHDDDGRAAGGATDAGTITSEQAKEIDDLLTETGSNTLLFLKACKVESIEAIRASQYDSVVKLIRDNAKRREAAQKGQA